MRDSSNDILKVAARLAHHADAAWTIAANATPGIDRLYWSKVGQDYADMAGTLRAAILIDNPDMAEIAA